jgi:hypothetical protein
MLEAGLENCGGSHADALAEFEQQDYEQLEAADGNARVYDGRVAA